MAKTVTWLMPEPISVLTTHALVRRFSLGHPLVAEVLLRRGLVGERLDVFLNPDLSRLHDPAELGRLDAAVRIMDGAIRSGRKMTIYGDYDVDGTTATALLVSYLRTRGGQADYYIPMRDEGYGLSKSSLDRIWESQRPEILVTVDCGTSSRAEVDYARQLGMEVIVTDHHRPTPGKETSGVVVNPHRGGDTYPNKSLAGVGVAYKLVAAHYGKHPTANLDLVSLGTIADVMALADYDELVVPRAADGTPRPQEATMVRQSAEENRILVRAGLERLAHTQRVGLIALLSKVTEQAACAHGFGGTCFKVSAEDVAFGLGPRINAIGRMNLDPMLVVELLTTDDGGRAGEIALLLDSTNKDRKEITNKLVDEAMAMVDPADPAIVIQLDLFKGVAGLVAGRLTSEFNKPAIVVDLAGYGSARSPLGVDLLTVLQAQFSHLVTAAGHAQAMGIRDLVDPAGLRVALSGYPWPAGLGTSELRIDAVATLADFDVTLVDALRRLEPTGQANPAPLFAVLDCEVVDVRIMKDRHLKLRLRDQSGAIKTALWFHAAKFAPTVGARIDVAARPSRNRDPRTGWESIELLVSSLRATTVHELGAQAVA